MCSTTATPKAGAVAQGSSLAAMSLAGKLKRRAVNRPLNARQWATGSGPRLQTGAKTFKQMVANARHLER